LPLEPRAGVVSGREIFDAMHGILDRPCRIVI